MTDLDAQTEAQTGAPPADAHTTKPHGGVPGVASPGAPPALAGGPAGGPVTSEQDGGGPVLTAARVSLVFWGSAWANPATSPSAAQFTAALTDLVTGPWGTQLNPVSYTHLTLPTN